MTQKFHFYIYSQQIWAPVHLKTCTKMFIAALRATDLNNPNVHSRNIDWINCGIYSYKEILFGNGNEQTTSNPSNVDESQKHDFE